MLACVPAADEPNKTLAVVKIVGLSVALVAIGAIVYLVGRRRAAKSSHEDTKHDERKCSFVACL